MEEPTIEDGLFRRWLKEVDSYANRWGGYPDVVRRVTIAGQPVDWFSPLWRRAYKGGLTPGEAMTYMHSDHAVHSDEYEKHDPWFEPGEGEGDDTPGVHVVP